MRPAIVLLLAFGLATTLPVARTSTQARKELPIYVVDVEGGAATLYVAPSGETLLIDAGNGDAAATRDAGRIMEAINAAGVMQIDHGPNVQADGSRSEERRV